MVGRLSLYKLRDYSSIRFAHHRKFLKVFSGSNVGYLYIIEGYDRLIESVDMIILASSVVRVEFDEETLHYASEAIFSLNRQSPNLQLANKYRLYIKCKGLKDVTLKLSLFYPDSY